MKQNKYRVHCALSDCYYYLAEKQEDAFGESSQLIYCTYPERDLTSDDRPCPYYRMDWKKKMKLVQEKIQANKAAKAKMQSALSSSAPAPTGGTDSTSTQQVAVVPEEIKGPESPPLVPTTEQPSPEKKESPPPSLPDALFEQMAPNDTSSNAPDLTEKESESKKD